MRKQKFLAALLALVMVMTLLPLTALAKDVTSIEYVKASTIESGSVYAIVHSWNEDSDQGGRILYHKDSATTTDQLTPNVALSASEGKLVLNTKGSWTDDCQLWTITGSEDEGYTVQSLSYADASNAYLNLSTTTTSKVNVGSAENLKFTYNEANGTWKISDSTGTNYLAQNTAGGQFYCAAGAESAVEVILL